MPHIFQSEHGDLVGKTGGGNGNTVPSTGESLGSLHTATVQITAALIPAACVWEFQLSLQQFIWNLLPTSWDDCAKDRILIWYHMVIECLLSSLNKSDQFCFIQAQIQLAGCCNHDGSESERQKRLSVLLEVSQSCRKLSARVINSMILQNYGFSYS